MINPNLFKWKFLSLNEIFIPNHIQLINFVLWMLTEMQDLYFLLAGCG